MSLVTTGDFGGTPFRALRNGANLTSQSEFNVRHIPGSNLNYVDISGPTPDTYDLECWFNDRGTLSEMISKVGSENNLNDGESGYDAMLIKVARKKVFGPGYQATTCSFLILS